jgi:hypothetical protein
MNRRRRPFIPLRKTIFVGCEGACEAGYVALLQDFARDAGLPVHLIVRELGPGAGDPLSRVEMAVRELTRHARTRTVIRDRFVLLDSDQAEADRDRAERARGLAAANKIAIVWQEPCFEALLLRHLPGCTTRRPPDTQGANQALEREWPEYVKPMSRAALARRIDLDAVRRAAGVEAGLRALLRCIALID